MKRRIAAVVLNSVSHDARVLKEADSLAAAGFDVRVFGLADNRDSTPVSTRDSGVKIHRLDWRPRAHRLGRIAVIALGLGLAAGLIVIRYATLEWAVAYMQSRAFLEHLTWLPAMFVLAFAARHALRPRKLPSGEVKQHRLVELLFTPARKLKSRLARLAQMQEFVNAILKWNGGPDAVHCHDLSAMPAGIACKRAVAAKGRSCKVVFDSHELYEEQSMASPMQKAVYRRRQRITSRHVDMFITINQSIADHLRQRYPALPEAVIIRNAVKLPPTGVAELLAEEGGDGRLHAAAKLDRSVRILLYQGGFAQYRGLEELVKAAPRLPDGWCLVMMGWGKHEPLLRRLADQVDSRRKKIRFVPAAPQAELVMWTSGASLGVIPYENICLNHWYCTPNKLWEYPSAGVPILASPFPEMRKVIEEFGIGRLISDPVDAANIAGVVSSVSEPQLILMRENCRRFIEQDNWNVYERKLVAAYEGLLGIEDRIRAEASPLEVVCSPQQPLQSIG